MGLLTIKSLVFSILIIMDIAAASPRVVDTADTTSVSSANPAETSVANPSGFDNSTAEIVEFTSSNTLEPACNQWQGACPTHNTRFDIMKLQLIGGTAWRARIHDCNQCIIFPINGPGGCYNFRSCGRDQSICIDQDNNRAHITYKDSGHKECSLLAYEGEFCGGTSDFVGFWWTTGVVPCTWPL